MANYYGTAGRTNVLTGGYGADRIYGADLSDTLRGGFGDDDIYGGAGDDRLFGDQGDDYLSGGDGADQLEGGGGEDTLYGGAGGDSLIGGLGDDYISVGGVSSMKGDRVDGDGPLASDSAGIDHLSADFTGRTEDLVFAPVDPSHTTRVVGSSLFKGIERFTIYGGSGDDSISGWSLDDTLTGGGGRDGLNGFGGDDQLDGGAGDDRLFGAEGDDDLDGGSGADALVGGAGDDHLYGGSGDDRLYGGSGRDVIYGGLNDDLIRGGSGDDSLTGDDGADVIYGDAGDDTLDGVEDYWGNSGVASDTLLGGAGDDVVKAGAGDVADGGDGVDTIVIRTSNIYIDLDFALSTGFVPFEQETTFTGFEKLAFYGSDNNYRVTGGALSDTLIGGEGDDRLDGGGGDDLLEDGFGSDTLFGGAGDDRFFLESGGGSFVDLDVDVVVGGSGYDVVAVDPYGSGVVLDLADQTLNDGMLKGDRFRGVEAFIGTNKDDVLRGDEQANTFYGGLDADILDGRGGDDRLQGGGGRDILTGGSGADVFDVSDIAYRYAFDPETGAYVPTPSFAARGDIFTDFSSAEGDKIQVSIEEFGPAADFTLTLGTDATTAARGFIFDARSHRLWFDQDGSGDGEKYLIATLDGVTALTRDDFVFVPASTPIAGEPLFG